MSRRWVIAGGGTGGHVTPALALGEALRSEGEAVRFVGTRRGIETRLVPEAGFELVSLDSRPLVGRTLRERVGALAALALATLAARRALREFGAEVVIAVGGYASVPPALAAWLGRIPTALVNTDATPGRANRLVGRFAGRIFLGFACAAKAFGRGARERRVTVSGVPLRAGLRRAFAADAASEAAARRPPLDPRGPLRVFVFGGSQGARQLNDLWIEALPHLAPKDFAIVHQTGTADRERVARAYAAAAFEAEVVDFEHDMPRRYRWAELVVCRAGALSVAELALAGRPSILIPLAHVGGGEQFANARELERVGAARVLDARQRRASDLVAALQELGRERARLAEMGKRAASLARPDAAEVIVRECRAWLWPERGGSER